ncbi:SLCO4C [Acanthosepion pharaonis]|uniref:SLCO4C n=1 Tax=Acanthosepion pharaonis TaxID=158019 RepID=A0A812DLN3_ACAPH|nr:SLCO4C [Sepia pharaonis]
MYIFLLGQILNGVGGATLYTVGFACIDDNVSHKRSPVYISILLCLTMVGVAVGYTAGGKLLDFHVDFLHIDSSRHVFLFIRDIFPLLFSVQRHRYLPCVFARPLPPSKPTIISFLPSFLPICLSSHFHSPSFCFPVSFSHDLSIIFCLFFFHSLSPAFKIGPSFGQLETCYY